MNISRYLARKYALLTASEQQSDKNVAYKYAISQLLTVSKSAIGALLITYKSKVSNPASNGVTPIVSTPTVPPTNPVVDNINKYFVFTPTTGTQVGDYEYKLNYSLGIVNDADNTFIFTPAIGKTLSDYEISF